MQQQDSQEKCAAPNKAGETPKMPWILAEADEGLINGDKETGEKVFCILESEIMFDIKDVAKYIAKPVILRLDDRDVVAKLCMAAKDEASIDIDKYLLQKEDAALVLIQFKNSRSQVVHKLVPKKDLYHPHGMNCDFKPEVIMRDGQKANALAVHDDGKYMEKVLFYMRSKCLEYAIDDLDDFTNDDSMWQLMQYCPQPGEVVYTVIKGEASTFAVENDALGSITIDPYATLQPIVISCSTDYDSLLQQLDGLMQHCMSVDILEPKNIDQHRNDYVLLLEEAVEKEKSIPLEVKTFYEKLSIKLQLNELSDVSQNGALNVLDAFSKIDEINENYNKILKLKSTEPVRGVPQTKPSQEDPVNKTSTGHPENTLSSQSTVSSLSSGGTVSTTCSGGTVSSTCLGGTVSTPKSRVVMSLTSLSDSESSPNSQGTVSSPISDGTASLSSSDGPVSTPNTCVIVSWPSLGGSESTANSCLILNFPSLSDPVSLPSSRGQGNSLSTEGIVRPTNLQSAANSHSSINTPNTRSSNSTHSALSSERTPSSPCTSPNPLSTRRSESPCSPGIPLNSHSARHTPRSRPSTRSPQKSRKSGSPYNSVSPRSVHSLGSSCSTLSPLSTHRSRSPCSSASPRSPSSRSSSRSPPPNTHIPVNTHSSLSAPSTENSPDKSENRLGFYINRTDLS